MSDLTGDLNATISSAVNARIEASVLAALSGDEVIGQYVAAALTQEIKKNSFDRKGTPFLSLVVAKAIQDATRSAVEELVAAERPQIVDEVKKALRRNLPAVADRLVDGMHMARYSVTVNVAEEV